MNALATRLPIPTCFLTITKPILSTSFRGMSRFDSHLNTPSQTFSMYISGIAAVTGSLTLGASLAGRCSCRHRRRDHGETLASHRSDALLALPMPGGVLSFPIRWAPLVRDLEGLSCGGEPQSQPPSVPGGGGRGSGGLMPRAWRARRVTERGLRERLCAAAAPAGLEPEASRHGRAGVGVAR